MKGLAIGYAICGVITALIYIAMLPKPRKTALPVIALIVLSGPITSWIIFWYTLNERLSMRELEKQLPELLAKLAQNRAHSFHTPPPNNRQWN